MKRTKSVKFTQEEIDHLYRPVSIKEVKGIINNPPKQKAPSPSVVIGE